MTRDDIIRMAREAGLANEGGSVEFNNLDGLEHFANLVAAAEREACARVCEARYMGDNNREDMEAKRCAAAIRAMGEIKDAPELFPGTLDALNALSIRSTSKTKT